MSTRSIIARVGEHEGQFAGRYVHADGMPTSMGKTLWSLLHGHFRNDLKAMLAFLIDAPHAVAGWSAIVGKDFTLKPGYTWQQATADGAKYEVYSQRPDYRRPQAFAGRKGEEAFLYTHEHMEDTDCEWLYVFDEENRKLFVRDICQKEDVVVVDLDGEEPNWSAIECGEDFARCKHYAWVHGLQPKTSNLSTQAWLGQQPLGFRDAIAFIINGKRYKNTGSGGNSDFLRRFDKNRFPSDTWVSSVIAGNGKRMDFAVAKIEGGEYAPLPGVSWVLPATKVSPERVVGA